MLPEWQAVLTRKNQALVLLPKCASQYIRQQLVISGNGRWKNYTPGWPSQCKDKEITVFFRHPFDRIVSGYYYFQGNRGKNYIAKSTKDMSYFSKTFEMYVAELLKLPDHKLDKHAMSQSYLLRDIEECKYICWDFKELQNYLGFPLGKEKYNSSKRSSDSWKDYFTNDQIDRLTIRFKEDLDIWQRHTST